MHELWENMLWLGPGISLAEKMIRPVLVYFFLMLGLRLAGKRELAQLNSMDLIVLLTISNTVQNAIIGPDNSVSGGIVGAATLLAVNHFVVKFLFGHEKINQEVEGVPVVLYEHGRIQVDHMKQELVTRAELETAAHKQGFSSLAHVERAILEPSGMISIVGKDPSPSEVHFVEVQKRLNAMGAQLSDIQKLLSKPA